MNEKHEMVIDYITENFSNFEEKKVLEAGGGRGTIIDNIPPCKEKIVIDIDKDRLLSSPDHKIICGDLCNTRFKDKEFDLCIFSEVLEHILSPESGIKELCRISKEIVLTTPNAFLLRRVLRVLLRRRIPVGHVEEYSYRKVIKMFKKEGFCVYKFRAIRFFIPFIKTNRFPRLSEKMLIHFKEL